MTKTQFKNMIKECLIELIQEGQLNEIAVPAKPANVFEHASNQSAFQSTINREQIRSTIRNNFLEPNNEFQSQASHTYSLNNAGPSQLSHGKQTLIEGLALGMAKGNPEHAATYAAIFADTAMHTVPKQAAYGDTQGASGFVSHGAGMTENVSTESIQQLAGGDMSRWATVAFGGKKQS